MIATRASTVGRDHALAYRVPFSPRVSQQQLNSLTFNRKNKTKENKQTNKQTQQPSPWALFLAHL